MKLYALTGGIAAGKSAASQRFVEAGYPVIDADKVAHELLEPGGRCVVEVVKKYGETILTDGRIDREKLGEIVFADADQLQSLNAIVHPAVGPEIADRIKGLFESGHEAVIVDAALIGEDGTLAPQYEALILVDAPEQERVRRMVQLRGMTEKDARQRIAAQTAPGEKRKLATWVIENAGSLEELRAQVDEICQEL